MIQDDDPVRLQMSVENFVKDKAESDYIIMSDRAYIEYMPSQFRKAAPVPEKMWEVKAFREKMEKKGDKWI